MFSQANATRILHSKFIYAFASSFVSIFLGVSLDGSRASSSWYYGVGSNLSVGDQLENVELLSRLAVAALLIILWALGGCSGRIIIIWAIILMPIILDNLHQFLFEAEERRLVRALGVLLLLKKQLVKVARLRAALRLGL